MIRLAEKKDIPAIMTIYNHYVEHSIVTFDKEPLTLKMMEDKILRIMQDYPCLIYQEGNEIAGFAYGSRFRPKIAYNNSAESTIYLDHKITGKGIGLKLYSALINQLKEMNIHTVIGGLSVPNRGSVVLHEKLGFKKVGVFSEVGFKFNKWIDVEFWQLTF